MSELHKALVKAQSQFPSIGLDKTVKVATRSGSGYEFSYASLEHIKAKTDPVLHKNGLAIVHVRDGGELISTLIHTSGECLESRTDLRIPSGASQQDEGSILSYHKRYNHAGLIGVCATADDDANIADGNSYKEKGKVEKKESKITKAEIDFRKSCGEAKKLIGEDNYYAILGECGFEKASDVSDKENRAAVLTALRTFYEMNKEEK